MLDLEDLAGLLSEHAEAYRTQPAPFVLRDVRFGHHPDTALMGVVNLSPDSWYRESVSLSVDAAVRRGRRLLAEGAALIDVGAESSVLTAARVGSEEQRARLIPVIERLVESGALVSVETYLPAVARAALEAGAAVLNLTAATATPEFYDLAAKHGTGVVLCYVQGANVREVADFHPGEDHVADLEAYFIQETAKARAAGVEAIWLDPGLGFYYPNLQDSAARVRYQMAAFLQAFRLRKLGFPVCQALPHAFEYFEDEVRCAEPFFAVLAGLGKTDLIRTHEVSRVRGVLRTMKVWDD